MQSSPQRFANHGATNSRKSSCERKKSEDGRSRSRDPLDNTVDTNNSAEEYTKLLRRRMISEVLQTSPNGKNQNQQNNNEIWQLQQSQERNSRKDPKRRPHHHHR